MQSFQQPFLLRAISKRLNYILNEQCADITGWSFYLQASISLCYTTTLLPDFRLKSMCITLFLMGKIRPKAVHLTTLRHQPPAHQRINMAFLRGSVTHEFFQFIVQNH